MEQKVSFWNIVMNCLLVADPLNTTTVELIKILRSRTIPFDLTKEILQGIHKAQEQHYDVILLDTRISGFDVHQVIRLLKSNKSDVRIIVETDQNSREFEALVRKEQIYYFHVDTFGLKYLVMAIFAALGLEYLADESTDAPKTSNSKS